MSETLKTLAAIILSVVMVGAAWFYQPKVAEVQSQERVGGLLFEEYGSQYVMRIEVEAYQPDPFRPNDSELKLEKMDLKQDSDIWLMTNHLDFEAGNSRKITAVTSILNQLKILEVVSQNPTDSDIRQFGLVDPAEGGDPNYCASKLRLTIEDPNKKVLELLVGKQARSSGGKQNTYYVKKADENDVFRVEILKEQLSARFIDWINPNFANLTKRNDQPEFYRIAGFDIRSTQKLKGGLPPYRISVDFLDRKSPVKLLQIDDPKVPGLKWIDLPTRPLPPQINMKMIGGWMNGIVSKEVALVAAVKAEKKGDSLSEKFLSGEIDKIADLGRLESMGFQLEKDGEKSQVVGSGGVVVASVLRYPIQFHFVYGNVTEDNLVPVVIYASVDKSKFPPAPDEPGQPESKDEKVIKAYEDAKRRYNKAVETRNTFIDTSNSAVEVVNRRLGDWIFFIEPTQAQSPTVPFDFSSHLKPQESKKEVKKDSTDTKSEAKKDTKATEKKEDKRS